MNLTLLGSANQENQEVSLSSNINNYRNLYACAVVGNEVKNTMIIPSELISYSGNGEFALSLYASPSYYYYLTFGFSVDGSKLLTGLVLDYGWSGLSIEIYGMG